MFYSKTRMLAIGAFILIVAQLGATRSAQADAKQFYYQRHQILRAQVANAFGDFMTFANFANPPAPPTLVSSTFQARLNPDDLKDQRTFKQRYLIETKYAVGVNAPVLFYICGEATCSSAYLDGAVAGQAKKFGANIIALEHRFYGESVPFPTLSTENLKYLSTDLALKDLDAFQKYAQSTLGFNGKWIAIGGSYPGSLSAFYREKYPANVAGALASSAPVMALENFEAYDLHVNTVAGPACADAIRAAVKEIEGQLKDPASALAIRKQFAAEAVTEDVDFLYLVADVAASAVQYGHQTEFCAAIQGANAIAGYGSFAQHLYQLWGVNALQFSVEAAFSEDPADYIAGFGLRSWFYQSCTEYGYFQNAYHDPALSTRSNRINPAYHAKLCERLFNIKDPVPTQETNNKFYLPLLASATAQKIFFTNGSNDPWSKLSITDAAGNNSNPELKLFTIQGASHCEDLGRPDFGDSVELKQARSMFEALASTWLK